MTPAKETLKCAECGASEEVSYEVEQRYWWFSGTPKVPYREKVRVHNIALLGQAREAGWRMAHGHVWLCPICKRD